MKQFWWHLRDELKQLALLLLASIPLDFGVRVRRLFMPCVLGRVGPGTSFQSGFVITNREKVSIGANCGFARRTFITGGGGVRIGDWVSFGPDVKVWSVNHRYADPDTPHLLQGWDKKPVVIEDDAWLGANVFVMLGVTIGRGAVVSAYTVVARSVSPFAIVAGNPGRIVGWRKRPPTVAGVPKPGPSAAESATPRAADAAGKDPEAPPRGHARKPTGLTQLELQAGRGELS